MGKWETSLYPPNREAGLWVKLVLRPPPQNFILVPGDPPKLVVLCQFQTHPSIGPLQIQTTNWREAKEFGRSCCFLCLFCFCFFKATPQKCCFCRNPPPQKKKKKSFRGDTQGDPPINPPTWPRAFAQESSPRESQASARSRWRRCGASTRWPSRGPSACAARYPKETGGICFFLFFYLLLVPAKNAGPMAFPSET